MDHDELVRSRHRPDWLAVLLGVTVSFALMGVSAIVGESIRLVHFVPTDSIFLIVCKLLWLLTTVTCSTYAGGFAAGLTMRGRSQAAAVLDGIMLAQFNILIFFSSAFFGSSPLPGVVFSLNPGGESSDGLLWWAMMITLPNFFAAIFGAMHGNRFVHTKDPIEEEVKILEKSERDKQDRYAA